MQNLEAEFKEIQKSLNMQIENLTKLKNEL